MSEEKSIIWRRLNVPGHEYARIFSENSKWFLEGTAIFVYEGKFCKLDYKIKCDTDWQTISTEVSGYVGSEKIEVKISVDEENRWMLNGAAIREVENCTDIDLNFSPLTNTLPIRRLALQTGEKAEVRAAWLRFPSFKLEMLDQVYERTGANCYRYESRGGTFTAEIETNDFGLITLYPDFSEIEK